MLLSLSAALVAVLVWGAPAEAKRKRRSSGDGPLTVVVMPFEGKGSGTVSTAEALELELELLPQVRMESHRKIRRALWKEKKRGNDPFEASTLAKIMKGQGVDVLVRGERVSDRRNESWVHVWAYAQDGAPRFFQKRNLPDDPDAEGRAIADKLIPSLKKWRRLPPMDAAGRVQKQGRDSRRVASRNNRNVDDDDVLVGDPGDGDDDDGDSGDTDLFVDDDVAPANEDPPPRKGKRSGDSQSRRALLDDDDADDEQSDWDQTVAADSRRRSVLDDDDGDDDDGGRGDARSSYVPGAMAEAEAEGAKDPLMPRRFSIVVGAEGSTWQYSFAAAPPGQEGEPVSASFYPGGRAAADVWRLPWVGLDGEIRVGSIPFSFAQGSGVQPEAFNSLQIGAAGALKARYVLAAGMPGAGFGARIGYRLWRASTQPQTIEGLGVTFVPGYQIHSLAVGPEVYLPLMNNQLEIQLSAEILPGLPATYEESPDNPGSAVSALGWSGELSVRYTLFAGVFVQVAAYTTGVRASFTGAGQRITINEDRIEGGTSTNLSAGGSLGVGYRY
jgi:hypothetical protein